MAGPDWECLALGKSVLPCKTLVPLPRRLYAVSAYAQACRIYRSAGFPGIRGYLDRLKTDFTPLSISDPDEEYLLASRMLVTMRWAGHLLREELVCLPSSVSLTAGLIALGLPAQVVIGKPKLYQHDFYEFHAWTEVNGVAINGNPMIQEGFLNLVRYPSWS